MRYASAKNEHVGLKQINYISRPNRQQIRSLSKHFGSNHISLTKGLRYNFSRNSVRLTAGECEDFGFARTGRSNSFLRAPRDRRSGAKRLNAPAFSAPALRSAVINRQMPALGRATGSPVVDSPVEDDSSSYTRAQRGVKNISITNTSAPNRFSKRRRVSIVIHSRGLAKNALNFRREWKIPPAGNIRRIEYDPGDRIKRTRRANANSTQTGSRFSVRREDRFDSRLHRSESFCSAFARCHGHSCLKEDVTLRIHEPGSHFCAANIHT